MVVTIYQVLVLIVLNLKNITAIIQPLTTLITIELSFMFPKDMKKLMRSAIHGANFRISRNTIPMYKASRSPCVVPVAMCMAMGQNLQEQPMLLRHQNLPSWPIMDRLTSTMPRTKPSSYTPPPQRQERQATHRWRVRMTSRRLSRVSRGALQAMSPIPTTLKTVSATG